MEVLPLTILGFALVLVLILTSLPIYLVFFIAAGILMIFGVRGPSFFPIAGYRALDNYVLLAVPLFMLAGDLMREGGTTTRLIDFVQGLVGRIRGGLGHVPIVASIFFGAITGSGLATAAAIGSITIPENARYGWDKGYTASVVAASGFLGFMIPPSIIGILYAFVSGVSVGAIFLATVVPGILIGIGYMILHALTYKKYLHPVNPSEPIVKTRTRRGGRALVRYGLGLLPAAMTPAIILGGIYGGVFTATEAAGVASVWALICGFFIYREFNLRSLSKAILSTSILTGSIFLMMFFANTFVTILVDAGMPRMLAEKVFGLTPNPIIIMLLLNVMLLFLGCFVDAIVITTALLPLFLPLATQAGIDLVHLGAVVSLNLGLGLITPPFAACSFITARIADVPLPRVFKLTVPYLFYVGVPALLITSYVPQLSLFLPRLWMGY